MTQDRRYLGADGEVRAQLSTRDLQHVQLGGDHVRKGGVVNDRTVVDRRNIAPKNTHTHADAAMQQRFPSHNCTFQRFTCLLEVKLLQANVMNTRQHSPVDGPTHTRDVCVKH